MNPQEERPIFRECPDCNGEGTLNLTDCCGAEPSNNGDASSRDYGICPDCKEYCDYGVECETCGGSGEIEMTEDEIQDMKDNESEYLYDVNKSIR